MSTFYSLEKKTILVMGGAGRIGQEIVRAALDAGANVIACDREAAAFSDLSGNYQRGRLFQCVADITDRASLAGVLAIADAEFGCLDGAVNTSYPRNANYGRHFFDVDYVDFCENTGLHMGGYFLFMQQCAIYSLEKKCQFSLVNMSSIYGTLVPRFDIYSGTPMTMPVEYAAIKAGIEHMTRYLNAYMKGLKCGFRANCISPGGILAGQNDDFISRYGEHCNSKGMLDAVDITGAVVFLLSDASRYVVAQNLVIDDGFST